MRTPQALIIQARMAARNGVTLDVVLRCCFAGYALLCSCLAEELKDRDSQESTGLKDLLATQAVLFDHLLAVISSEHSQEMANCLSTNDQRRATRVKQLLNGELDDCSDLAYDFEVFHLGLIAKGPGAIKALRELSSSVDRRLLAIRQSKETIWAWFGGRRPFDSEEVERCIMNGRPEPLSIAIGEAMQGVRGWRLTHKQAHAAAVIAGHTSSDFMRYADVALLSSTLSDDLLAASLRELFLAPLESTHNGGVRLTDTLRAYLGSGYNVSSTAAVLGVSRPTVANRLRMIEAKIGRSIVSASAEIEVALRLQEFDAETGT
jgi:hypothetical protein